MTAVASFQPFPALRYATNLELENVLAPPYDVIDDAERAALAKSADAVRDVVSVLGS